MIIQLVALHDGSMCAEAALDKAIYRGQELKQLGYNVKLTILHIVDLKRSQTLYGVIHSQKEEDNIKSYFEQRANSIVQSNSFKCTIKIAYQSFKQILFDIQPDEIFIGYHRRGQVGEMITRSTLNKVLDIVDCPVTVIQNYDGIKSIGDLVGDATQVASVK